MEKHNKKPARNSTRTCRGMRPALALLMLCAGLVFSDTSFASETLETKRVLILYSFRYGLSTNALTDANKIAGSAIQTTMEEGLEQKIAFHSERMDVSTLPENRYFDELRDAYRKKYADQPMDLIIAVNYRALNFLINHGEEIWPNIPILFSGLEEGRRKQLKTLRPNITGLFGNARFGDMLDTILKIHPETRQITVIVGTSATDRFVETRVHQSFRKFVGQVDFTYLSDFGFDAILNRVAALPPKSIVLFLTLLQDGEGKPVPENSLSLISRVSNAPVYGLFDAYVGHGIVGGSVYSIEDRGLRIGKVGVRILAGEKPNDIPMKTEQKHLNLFDWRQLARWGIAERDLPPGSIVRFRNPTFYETYKWYIWGGFSLVLFEAVLIILLLMNRSRYRRAERKLQRAHHKLEESNIGLKNEIDERKRIEEALKESESCLKAEVEERKGREEELRQNETVIHEQLSDIKQLKMRLENENIHLRQEIELKHKHEEIVGRSEGIKHVLSQVEKVAAQNTCVLITGETGTGKELVAHAIHSLSLRKGHVMIKVNCAALPVSLIESELFGREKGAFTGALTRQIGRFEAAHRSTIFLDEIGDLPPEIQVKLLRVLQEGKFERLGSTTTIESDVRIIAATNKNLPKALKKGTFRKDLYYRLHVFPIIVPPLRERRDDIPLLTWSFVREFENAMGRKIESISKYSMELLQAYSWPGNVRELKNVIERAVILCEDSDLSINRIGSESSLIPNATLEDVTKNHILETLENARWRVSGKNGAAEILGLKRTTLLTKMKKLNIKRPHKA